MHRVRFLADRIVQNEHRHDPQKQTVMRAGHVYELSEASYQHWLARAPIEIVADEVVSTTSVSSPPPPAASLIVPVSVPVAPPAPEPFLRSSQSPFGQAVAEPESKPEDKPSKPEKPFSKGNDKPKG